MTNISTLFMIVNSFEGSAGEEAGLKALMSDDESDYAQWLVERHGVIEPAPENAVRNILGFARSYKVLSSKSLEHIDLYEN